MWRFIKKSLCQTCRLVHINFTHEEKKKNSFPISVKFYARLLAIRFKSFIKEEKYRHIALLIDDLF